MASLEKRCMEKQNEIAELERRIEDKLEDELLEKQEKQEEHNKETKVKKDKNAAMRKQLKESLTKLEGKSNWASVSIESLFSI